MIERNDEAPSTSDPALANDPTAVQDAHAQAQPVDSGQGERQFELPRVVAEESPGLAQGPAETRPGSSSAPSLSAVPAEPAVPGDPGVPGEPAAPAEPGAEVESGPGEPLLAPELSATFRERWEQVQTRFVDQPRGAVEEADGLVASLMQQLADGFAQERERLEAQSDRGENISTEDLRVALKRYRSFFQRLLST